MGTLVRLRVLRADSVLYRKFRQAGYTSRDDMTLELLAALHCRLFFRNLSAG